MCRLQWNRHMWLDKAWEMTSGYLIHSMLRFTCCFPLFWVWKDSSCRTTQNQKQFSGVIFSKTFFTLQEILHCQKICPEIARDKNDLWQFCFQIRFSLLYERVFLEGLSAGHKYERPTCHSGASMHVVFLDEQLLCKRQTRRTINLYRWKLSLQETGEVVSELVPFGLICTAFTKFFWKRFTVVFRQKGVRVCRFQWCKMEFVSSTRKPVFPSTKKNCILADFVRNEDFSALRKTQRNLSHTYPLP